MSQLANLPDITELLKYTLFSDYIELDPEFHETVLSVMIVAPPGHGKSSAEDQFAGNDGLLTLGNATAWGIENTYLAALRKGVYRRILIPDFINPNAKKQGTVDSTMVFFNSYISWEGVSTISTYATRISLTTPVKGGLITTMATGDFQRMVRRLAAVGFLSRILIIGYEYTTDEARALLDDVCHRRSAWKRIALEFPKKQTPVSIDTELMLKMKELALVVGARGGDITGIRALNHLTILAKSKALSEGRSEVVDNDIYRVMHLADQYVGKVAMDARTKRLVQEAEERREVRQ